MSTGEGHNAVRSMPSSAGCLGHVLAVEGSQAEIGLTRSHPEGPERPTVGKFIAIKGHGTTLVAMISEVSLRATEVNGSRTVARVDLLGEIERTEHGERRFRRGVRDYAAIGDPVEMISRDELKLIYAASGERAITVGHLSQDPSIPAYIDVDHMLAKHFAVVGSTGVGKSSAVASILGKMIDVRPDLRVLLLDIHNEYRAAFESRANVIGGENLRLPFWLFNFDEILNVLYAGKPAGAEEVEILAELIPIAKAMHHAGAERVSVERRQAPRHGGFTADTPVPYHLSDLLALIAERMGKLENRSSAMSHHRLMGRIDAIKSDPRYEFMFRHANLGGDTMAAVLNQVFSLESEDRPLTILKLASLPDEVVDAVVCVLARLRRGAQVRFGGPAIGVCARQTGPQTHRAGRAQIWCPPRAGHAATVRTRPDDLVAMFDVLRNADDQRCRPGAASCRRLRGSRQPSWLRAFARRAGGDRDRRGSAPRGAHHFRHLATRGNPARRIQLCRSGRGSLRAHRSRPIRDRTLAPRQDEPVRAHGGQHALATLTKASLSKLGGHLPGGGHFRTSGRAQRIR